jgi:hypothetical protein
MCPFEAIFISGESQIWNCNVGSSFGSHLSAKSTENLRAPATIYIGVSEKKMESLEGYHKRKCGTSLHVTFPAIAHGLRESRFRCAINVTWYFVHDRNLWPHYLKPQRGFPLFTASLSGPHVPYRPEIWNRVLLDVPPSSLLRPNLLEIYVIVSPHR